MRDRNINSRLWLWCHRPGAHNGKYNLPVNSSISPVEASARLGINQLIYVHFGAQDHPREETASQLRGNDLVWSMTGAGGNTSQEGREKVLSLANNNLNIKGFIFDDFWETPNGFAMSREELRDLKARAEGMDFWAVLYVAELFREGVKDYLEYFDRYTIWNWHPPHLATIEDKLDRFREMLGDKKQYMGVYLWDYDKGKPMPNDLLKHQLRVGLDRMKDGSLEGMIFLASCVMDMELESVEILEDWLKLHSGEIL